ncbi:MAG: LPXTG cell wall anchor domain-containing protein [Oscillospiraceae bacterium]|nr:LPXTG cell wall anchor domain-containing protein [Oscillospiraceae bacterium]
MRKLICLLTALLVCVSLACPAFAAGDTFVPSISYKDGPEIEDAEMNGEDVEDCLVVSSITDAKNKSTDIYQEDRDLLLEVYDKLDDGSMKLPLENDEYVIRELVDVSFEKSGCVEPAHGHQEWLAQESNTVTIKFDLGVAKATDVVVMVYVNGEWTPVESVENNGDGTVTCVFEDICPVAFCVEADSVDSTPQTGDAMNQNLILWIVLMAVSLAAIVILVVSRRKQAR